MSDQPPSIHERLEALEGKRKTASSKNATMLLEKHASQLAAASGSLDALLALQKQLNAIRHNLTVEVGDLMANAADINAQIVALDTTLDTISDQVDQQLENSISAEDAQGISDNLTATQGKADAISEKLPPVVTASPGRKPTRR